MFSKKDQTSTGKKSQNASYKLSPEEKLMNAARKGGSSWEEEIGKRQMQMKAREAAEKKEKQRVSKNFLNLATKGTDLNDNKFGKGYSITKRDLPRKK